MGLITVLFLLICFPAEAEQEGDKDPASISGGVILQEYPTEVYKAPEEMAVYSELPDSINLSASNYFPPIREIKIRIYCI